MEGLLGVKYEPLALLSTQLVSGTNYCFLCEGTTVTPGEPASLYLVKVYADLQGGAEILEITGFEAEEAAERAADNASTINPDNLKGGMGDDSGPLFKLPTE